MIFLFLATVFFAAFGWRYAFTSRERVEGTLQEYAGLALYAYLSVMLAALPLAWFDRWSLSLHGTVVGLLALGPALFVATRIRKRTLSFHFGFSLEKVGGFLGVLALGIALQWKGIYHYYATHDPSAYLNSAQHLARQGHFSHYDEITELAYGKGNEALKALLNLEKVPEGWMLTSNYGILSTNPAEGLSAYHGLFGAPVWLALGATLFGEAHALKIHWLHFAVTLLLLLAILERWLPVTASRTWFLLAGVLFAICPLTAPLYREPLSEPLAALFFLGMIWAFSETRPEERAQAAYTGLACLVASLAVRISGLFYIPFFFLSLFFAWNTKENFSKKTFGWVSLVAIGFGVALLLRTSPGYANGIFGVYSSMLTDKIPVAFHRWVYLALAMCLIGLGAIIWKFRNDGEKLVSWLESPKVWRWSWRLYLAGLFAGLAFRYVKLVFKMSYSFGGFPFVLYYLDSLFFYGGPILVGIGFYYWGRRLRIRSLREEGFLQLFLPFCLFFYSVFRFFPLDLQVNFQRYLLIEAVPLLILGAVVTLADWMPQRRKMVLAAVVFSLGWSGLLTSQINHFDMSATAFTAYHELDAKLAVLRQTGRKPVIVGVASDWIDRAFLMPMSTGFGYSVLFANDGFSKKESTALSKLKELGFLPVLAIAAPHRGGKETLVENGRQWKKWNAFQDCYLYPRFNLAAPPLYLEKTCNKFSLLTASEEPVLQSDVHLAWRYEEQKPPFSARHWVGFNVAPKKDCQSENRIFSTRILFDPERRFTSPTVFLNGVPFSEGERSVASEPVKRTHQLELSISEKLLNCGENNVIDIFFAPRRGGLPTDGEVMSYGWEK